jgi:NAD(P)-dependent dehydrogenase (short-subunit alcohol dehydrogenase family)
MSERTALVTGGSTGIGQSICEHFLAAGYTVLNLSRREATVKSPRLHDFPVDLADREATRAVAANVAAQFAVDTLVHNAGLIRPALIEEVTLEDLDYLTEIHLGSGITLLQACLPAMKKQGFGRVINMSSRALLGLETRTNYAATKAAIIGQTRTWALELGGHGITVNAVAPGPIAATEMFHNVVPQGDPKIDQIARSIPVKRVGHPSDVARAVLFLADADNGFITGQTLFVCGGASLGSLSL